MTAVFKATLVGAVATALLFAASGAAAPPNFRLGTINSINATSTLTGAVFPGALLDVINSGDGSAVRGESRGGPALTLVVDPASAPMTVSSRVKVDDLNADLLDNLDSSAFWKLGGNAGTTPGTDFLGTTDNEALELNVNGQRALRIEPDATSPNLIGGFAGNSVGADVHGVTIGGGGAAGLENVGIADFATVGGGADSFATGLESTVSGGAFNTASGTESTVSGGAFNTASGSGSTVAGGEFNAASGTLSFAAGLKAQAIGNGSFVWGDASTSASVISPAANTVTVRASNGIWLGTTSSPSIPSGHFLETSTGGYLSSAGVWTDASDRALKHDFRSLDKRSVLEKVARMPITSWSYKAEKPSVRHIGPMAQDFYKAFGLGLDDKHIGTVDEGGVALAAIQGLYRQNEVLKARLSKSERANAGLSARLARVEHQLRIGERSRGR